MDTSLAVHLVPAPPRAGSSAVKAALLAQYEAEIAMLTAQISRAMEQRNLAEDLRRQLAAMPGNLVEKLAQVQKDSL